MTSNDGKPLTGSEISTLPDQRAYSRNCFPHLPFKLFFKPTKASFTSAFQLATQLHNNITPNNMAQLTRRSPDPFYEDSPEEEEYHDYLRECVTQSHCRKDTC